MQPYKFYLFLFLAIININNLLAQSGIRTSLSPTEKLSEMQKKATSDISLENATKDMLPVGDVVNPIAYFVGPNDLLSIQIMPVESVPQLIYITSDNSLVLPSFGVINVSGLTLRQVGDTLAKLLHERGRNNQTVAVSLVRPRNVFVTISGNVISPGTYSLPASYSIATALKIANQAQTSSAINQEEQSTIMHLQESKKERERIFSETGVSINSSYSLRNIRIMKRSGTAMIADLDRAYATGNPLLNPFICEGDEISVPFEPDNFPTIAISGEVIRPVSIVHKSGDMASHLLKLSAGFTGEADLSNIHIYDGSQNKIQLQVDTTLKLLSQDIALKPGNVIIIGRKININSPNMGVVAIKGEINLPGVYPIILGKTRLKDVIQEAGGFTNNAYLLHSYIDRRDNSTNDRIAPKRLFTEYFQGSDLSMEDTTRFTMFMELKRPKVSCDFEALFNNNSEGNNVLIKNGDVINVAAKADYVSVFGKVNKPGYVDFVPGQTMEWYIMKAGGYATGAEKKRSRIIRANKIWQDGFSKDVYVNAGDEIYVSPPQDIPAGLMLQKWATVAGMIGALAGIISLVYTVFRY